MRPFKHVAREGRRDPENYQNILGIDLGRFRARWGEVPIVATTESERITLYYWDDLETRWSSFEKHHDPITFAGSATESPADWNWSDRVAVACSRDTVYVIYKRAIPPDPVSIYVDRYQPASGNNDHSLQFVDSVPLQKSAGAGINQIGQDLGRSLWAACDEVGSLFVLFQRRNTSGFFTRTDWELVIQKVRFQPNGTLDSQVEQVGEGGFDLDARLDGRRIIAVYRKSSEAFRIPFVMLLGGRHLTSGADADPFYQPLQLTTINTQTLDSDTEEIPGGEHPQIQRTSPLLITMDRPSTLDLSLDTPILPLPPRRPHAIWDDGRMDKIAWLRDGVETFRGTLLTSDAIALPRSHAAMSQSTHLFEDRRGLMVHASPFANFPVHVLSMSRQTKELVLDVLHHRDFVGLFRTRLGATLSDGVLSVHDRAFEVWDIGHAQIGNPDFMDPSGDGETRQFGPAEALPLTAAVSGIVRDRNADNTIGGHLTAETTREPVGFFAYSDLGDGCLRVIFANDIPALADPPPIDSEKLLRPEQVTGPHLPCDEWIELSAADFVESDLIGYSVGLLLTDRSLGSALEVPIDFLLDACVLVNGDQCFAGDPPLDPFAGLTRAQFTKIDAFRVKRAAPLVLPLILSDGTAITVSVFFRDPQGRCIDAPVGALVEGLAATLSVDVGGNAPIAQWTITSAALADRFLPPGPVSPGELVGLPIPQLVFTANPVTFTLPFDGLWRLSVFIPDGTANPPGVASDIDVQQSVYEMIRGMYRGISRGEFHRIGNLNVSAFQYAITYQAVDGDPPTNIAIATQPKRNSEFRFQSSGLGQGIVEGALVLSFSTDQLKLRFGLDLAFTVKSFKLDIHYGRPFTAGMLMRDQRSRDVLDGHLFDEGGFEEVSRRDPGSHASIGGKPFGDADVFSHNLDVDVEMTFPGVAIPTLLSLLAVIGAFGIIQIIVGLLVPAVTPVIAIIAIVSGAVVAIAVWLLISILVPPYVENFISERINDQFSSGDILDQLNGQPILRYAGEGMAEAIARKALAAARDRGFNVPAPADSDDDSAGFERAYGQLFQIVFVSDGICRVLLRLDDCHDQINLPTPGNGDDDGDDGPPLITPGRG